jgi:TolB-like protein
VPVETSQADPLVLPASNSQRIGSIAVLPLENLSGNPAQEYFSDGMTDELIGEIARIASLRVTSRTSSMRYKGGARKSLPEIARELSVDAILEGTVVQAGRRVRITAKLIRANDDRHLWSGKYERDLADVLALQSEVARTVAREIQIKLTPLDETSLVRTRPVNPEAWEAFLKGNFSCIRASGASTRAWNSSARQSSSIRLPPSPAPASPRRCVLPESSG